MGELNYLRIAQVLGGRLTRIRRPRFGGSSLLDTASRQFLLLDSRDHEEVSPRHFADVAASFESVRDGYELDRVLVDPILRVQLIKECRSRGVDASDRAIFKRLQAFRKSNSSGIRLRRTTRPAEIDVERVFYAAELGLRQMTLQRAVTVDDILTDPAIGTEFDERCLLLATTGTSMQFRWAALRIRKRYLSKESIDTLLDIRPSQIEAKLTEHVRLGSVRLDRLPEEKGIFSFAESGGARPYLYVGNAKSLKEGIEPFREAKPFRLAAGSFWNPDPDRIELRYGIFKQKWMGASAKDLTYRLIRDRAPLFNVPLDFEREPAA